GSALCHLVVGVNERRRHQIDLLARQGRQVGNGASGDSGILRPDGRRGECGAEYAGKRRTGKQSPARYSEVFLAVHFLLQSSPWAVVPAVRGRNRRGRRSTL